ncbi:transposase [Streptomyces sp. NPDC001393]
MPPGSARKKGGEATGPSPVDRGKTGSKHHLICDGRGTPFKVITTAANVNDVTQTLALVDSIPPVAGKPGRPRRRPDAVLGDTGYDSNPNRRELRRRRILPVTSRTARARVNRAMRPAAVAAVSDMARTAASLPRLAFARLRCVRASTGFERCGVPADLSPPPCVVSCTGPDSGLGTTRAPCANVLHSHRRSTTGCLKGCSVSRSAPGRRRLITAFTTRAATVSPATWSGGQTGATLATPTVGAIRTTNAPNLAAAWSAP